MDEALRLQPAMGSRRALVHPLSLAVCVLGECPLLMYNSAVFLAAERCTKEKILLCVLLTEPVPKTTASDIHLFPPVSIIPPMLHIHLHLHVARTRTTTRRRLETFQTALLLRKSGGVGQESASTVFSLCAHAAVDVVQHLMSC
jgi:hypothetical protein